MTTFSGQFQYLSGSAITQQGPCRVEFDSQSLALTPESGAPLVCDLGDLNAVTSADWEIRLPLYTGSAIVLRQFGKAYETLSHDLLEAYRKRTLQCLLLEDMEEVARFNGNFTLHTGNTPASGAESAEVRLYKTNLAVLPVASQGFQWRLADVDSVHFDPGTYEVVIQSAQDILKIGKLGKRSEEFVAKVKDAVGELAASSAQALHAAFPFLDPDQLQATAVLLREGRSAPVAELARINAKFPSALAANAVDKDLKPYYEYLLSRTAKDSQYAGFKLVRQEQSGLQGDDGAKNRGDKNPGDKNKNDEAAADSDGSAPDSDATGPETLYWFFLPLAARSGSPDPSNVVAWEASSRSGRATYFFRVAADTSSAGLEAGIRRLNRVLALVNFRRRPIYLTDDELQGDPKFHRYAIAARRIPEVRAVRSSFLGRATHSAFEGWQAQVKTILAKAGIET